MTWIVATTRAERLHLHLQGQWIVAHARDIRHQDTRVELEREAGKLLAMAA